MRFASPNLDNIPAGTTPSDLEFMAPETRNGDLGDTASDVYAAGAVLYFAVTGVRPPLDSRGLVPPTELRPICPQVIERILLRAMQHAPEDRFFSAGEMLEHFAAEAGAFDPAWTGSALVGDVASVEDPTVWEKRLRRALGDDYELLFTTSSRLTPRARAILGTLPCGVTEIGRILERSEGLRIVDASGKTRRLRARGFDHFGDRGSGVVSVNCNHGVGARLVLAGVMADDHRLGNSNRKRIWCGIRAIQNRSFARLIR